MVFRKTVSIPSVQIQKHVGKNTVVYFFITRLYIVLFCYCSISPTPITQK